MTLSVNRIVNVSVTLSPKAAQRRGFGVLCILGDSDILTAIEGYRSYSDADSVAADFGTDAPETLAAQAYYSQSPQPSDLLIARWFNKASAGCLYGGNPDQTFSNLQVSDGSLKIAIDGQDQTLTAIDTTGAESLKDIADILTTKLTDKATVAVSSGRFVITSKTTGASSKVGFATTAGSGTDLSSLLGLTEGKGAKTSDGLASQETIHEALSRLLSKYGRVFYGFITATTAKVSDDDIFQIAQTIESAKDSHIYAITLTDSSLMDTAYTAESNDIASKLMRGQYTRTISFYSDYVPDDSAYRLNPYLNASALGRMFTVNFEGYRTMITLKFKQAPSLQPSNLDETQATNLEARNINVYTIYDNDTYIIEQGVMASGMYADERHGADWLQNAVQTDVYNVLYQNNKIDQTDDGIGRLIAAIAKTMRKAVQNGMLAPGVWNASGFGSLKEGDTLEDGFYIYADSVNNQNQADREARKSPPIQVAAKLAGAIHSVDVSITLNR